MTITIEIDGKKIKVEKNTTIIAAADKAGIPIPGGKVETGEQPRQALVRELKEELDIQVTACEPFMQVSHDYTDKQVLLDIWRVTAFEGEARGMEGQDCRWVALTDLLLPDSDYAFPAANQGILDRLALGL